MRLRPGRAHVALGLMLLALAYGLATGFPFLYRLTYLLGFLVAASYLTALAGSLGLRVEARRRTFKAQVGEALDGWLEVTNTGPLAKPFLEVTEETTVPGHRSSRVTSLPPRSTQGWRSGVVALRRGVYQVGPVAVTSTDPFGLFRRTRRFGQAQEVVVYPAAEPLPGLGHGVLGVPGEGSRQRASLQATPSAYGVRQYTPGDALRRIHWPTTARHGALMVKRYDEEVGSALWIFLDLDASVQTGEGDESTEEYAVRAAASVAQRAVRTGLPVGLIATGDVPAFLPADRGQGQMARLMEALARVRAGPDRPLWQVLEERRETRLAAGALMVVTPSPDPRWVHALAALAGARSGSSAVVLDAESFGGEASVGPVLGLLDERGITGYVVRQGMPLSMALGQQRGARPLGAAAGVQGGQQ